MKPALVTDEQGRLSKAIARRPRYIFDLHLAPVVTLFTQPLPLLHGNFRAEPLNVDEPEITKQRFLFQVLFFSLRVAASPLSWNVQVKFLLLELVLGRQMERVVETSLGRTA